jgi:bacterioferritin
LRNLIRKESIEEMQHADRIIERILFLEGTPNISTYDKITIGADVKQQLDNDLALEIAALVVLRDGIKTCVEAVDDASRELLEHILVDEEEHVDWIETQLHQIKEIGYQNYLTQQIKEKD